MIDWTKSMQQTYEYYIVDPITFKDIKKINNVKGCTIDRDSESDTLGSATIDIDGEIGEVYVRAYLIAIQNGVTAKVALGTFLIQTLVDDFDGKTDSGSLDMYTPLIELKEKYPPIGFYIPKGENVMDHAYRLTRENMRAPVIKTPCDDILSIDFISDNETKFLPYLKDLISNAKHEFMLDEMGRVLFTPKQDTASLQPVWTYDDGNSSILYPSVKSNRDLYMVPNYIEVVCSNGNEVFRSVKENNDIDSPTSIVNRGRRIEHRVTDPSIIGTATQERVDEYAETLLRELSTIEYTLTYQHGYCPVRVGDCVRFNYVRAGLTNIKAKVIKQSISCTPGCPVSETAVFTTKLWR